MSLDPPSARCFALVPCAGKGERAGTSQPKQYVSVAGSALVAHTLKALSGVARLEAVMVVLHPQDDLFESQVPGFNGWVERVGGVTRADSVLNGLSQLRQRGAHASDWVLVHDAARCLLRPEWLNALIEACEGDAVGGLLALPVADTLKQAQQGRVYGGVDRSNKWLAQTPQMFRLGLLQEALTQALQSGADNITDESSAIERAGYSPLLVPGSMENFKVTYPPDIELAAKLLKLR